MGTPDRNSNIKEERMAARRAEWIAAGLDPAEADELVQFEFVCSGNTLEEQLRRYYLKVKVDVSAARAEQMLSAMSGFTTETVRNLDDAARLCATLRQFVSGFVIRLWGKSYTFSQGCFQEA